MRRILLYVLAADFVLTGIFILFFPKIFYDLIPGLAAMGPFNVHFLRDVAFAFMVSGAALIYGQYHLNKAVAVVGAAWPFLHALFHLQIWAHRGFPFDLIWLVDVTGVIIPGLLILYLALQIKKTE